MGLRCTLHDYVRNGGTPSVYSTRIASAYAVDVWPGRATKTIRPLTWHAHQETWWKTGVVRRVFPWEAKRGFEHLDRYEGSCPHDWIPKNKSSDFLWSKKRVATVRRHHKEVIDRAMWSSSIHLPPHHRNYRKKRSEKRWDAVHPIGTSS